MFALPDSWLWDFWLAEDDDTYHLFFLYASRALHDPDRRHLRAAIGHATSTDLVNWEQVPDALVHGDAGEFDQTATWTGSVIKGPEGDWFMFYTGTTQTPDGPLIQQVGLATSTDLIHWVKDPRNPLVQADSRWYETLGGAAPWTDEHWRDPFVLADPGGNGWHLLITARANTGPYDDRGVIGHARSADLRNWDVQPPLSDPGAGFGQLEVFQTANIDGRARVDLQLPTGRLLRGTTRQRRPGRDLGGHRRIPARPLRHQGRHGADGRQFLCRQTRPRPVGTMGPAGFPQRRSGRGIRRGAVGSHARAMGRGHPDDGTGTS